LTPARAAIRYWALLGGIIVLALAIYTAASALRNLVLGAPLPGEYELAMHFVAIAVFCFLPYCQLTGANVTVDIFTEGMGARAKAGMALVSALLAIVLAALLVRQMSLGFTDYLRYPEVTPILHVPLWTAFPPILLSLALLLLAALITLRDAWRDLRPPRQPPADGGIKR
jgi:TRAP-type C4-dicarboxylate transport system permease small subunit